MYRMYHVKEETRPKVGLEGLLKVRKLLLFLITTKNTGIKRHHNESPFLYQGILRHYK